MAQFRVVAEKLWHSGECKHYLKGEVVNLPDGTTVKEGGAIEPIRAKSGKAKDTPAETEGQGENLA